MRFLLTFVVVSFVVWQANFAVLRYAAVLEALTPLLVLALMVSLIPRATMRVAGVVAACALIAVSVRPKADDPVYPQRVDWGDTFWEVELP
ncbi:MAG: hypothetical protein R3184_10315, partial [Aurantimonas coralicida]|nr:hypothetical protein [Aurantimonas coralicida]